MKEKVCNVNRCDHCPFSTAQGKYYCVLAARVCIVPEIVPTWCPLLERKMIVSLDKKHLQPRAAELPDAE